MEAEISEANRCTTDTCHYSGKRILEVEKRMPNVRTKKKKGNPWYCKGYNCKKTTAAHSSVYWKRN